MLLFWYSPMVSKLKAHKTLQGDWPRADPWVVPGYRFKEPPISLNVFCPTATGLGMLDVYPSMWRVLLLLCSSTHTKIKADLATAYPVSSEGHSFVSVFQRISTKAWPWRKKYLIGSERAKTCSQSNQRRFGHCFMKLEETQSIPQWLLWSVELTIMVSLAVFGVAACSRCITVKMLWLLCVK